MFLYSGGYQVSNPGIYAYTLEASALPLSYVQQDSNSGFKLCLSLLDLDLFSQFPFLFHVSKFITTTFHSIAILFLILPTVFIVSYTQPVYDLSC